MPSARVLLVFLVLATSSTAIAATKAIKFGKLIDGTGRVFTNAVVIVAAGLYIFWREEMRAGSARAPPLHP